MDTNLVLIISLSSGLAFLNIVVFTLWYLWEQKRRKIKDLERDKLTSLSHCPRKLVKRNRPPRRPPPSHTHPEKYDTHSRSEPVRNSEPTYLPSPYDFPRPPKHKTVHPLGVSPLRNELYSTPTIQRKTSTQSCDTASIYSTVSAPVHLHEELLSETHSSLLTVDILDTLNMVEKYDPRAHYENPSLNTVGSKAYVIQNPMPVSCEPIYSPPNHLLSLQPDVKREICTVLPFHSKDIPFESQDVPQEQFPYIIEEDFPSRLQSPHSP